MDGRPCSSPQDIASHWFGIRDLWHFLQVLERDLAGSQEQHEEKIRERHPRDQDESVGRCQGVCLCSHLLAENRDCPTLCLFRAA